MALPPDAETDERVLVAAPLGRDCALTLELLRRHGFEAEGYGRAADLAAAVEAGAGLAVLTEEFLANGTALAAIAEALSRQPPWSDFPLLVFTSAASGNSALARFGSLGNVALIERPIQGATLVSAVNAALRSRRRQYQVRDLVRQLQDGVRHRDHFLAMLSHELRNPLSAILTAADLLGLLAEKDREADFVESFDRYHAIIRRQGHTLTRLMDDLLEVARVTSGKLRLSLADVDLREVVRRAVDAVGPRGRQGGLTIACAIEPDRPLLVRADSTRLEQVLGNLLNNAIKYTPTGGSIQVTLSAIDGEAVVAVRDTGTGIDSEALSRVFELFSQADGTLDRAQGGLGLGLTLVRSLVELHGGRVAARSEGLGRGSEFEIRLPVVSSATRPPEPPLPARADEIEGRRVFVLEDQADNRDTVVAVLRHLGCEVDSESDGSRGLERIAQWQPDLAIIDIGLPGLDGYTVASRVRASLGDEIVLVALSGYGQAEDRERARQAGFDDHITKPADLDRLRELLARPPRTRAHSGPGAAAEPLAPRGKPKSMV